MSDMTKLLVVK